MKFLYASLLLISSFAFAQQRIIPHVTRVGGGFESRVLLANLGDREGTVTLTGYEELDGEVVGVTTETVAANLTTYKTIEALFGSTNVSHFTIDGDDHVTVSITYQALRDGSGPAHVRETSETAYRWRIYLGDRKVTWDGLVVVNMGKNTTPLTVFGYSTAGKELSFLSPFYPLKTMEKETYFLSDLFESNPDYFELLAAEPICVMALRGELNSTFLWKNDALPMAFTPPQ